MSPTAMMMIHKVSTYAEGNSDDLDKTSNVLKIADQTVANAYIAKSGMSMKDALKMMSEETWFTAQQAKDKGLIDGIMFEDTQPAQLNNSFVNLIPPEIISKMQNERLNNLSKDKLQNKLNYLKLKGVE